MSSVIAAVTRFLGRLAATLLVVSGVSAHPGSGIVVDRQGQVYFVDTGLGVWRIDRQGRMARHPGPAYHWMTIDPEGRFNQQRMPRGVGGELTVVGLDPTLIISSDFPVTIGSDGAFYYPQAGRDGRVRVMRRAPSGEPGVFATLPIATETGPDGQAVQAEWVHGLAAGPNGYLYYTERDAVRRIAPDGTVSLVAGRIAVPDCVHPPAAKEERLGPALRGLDVTPDGTVYVAASACSALLKITPGGAVSVVLRASDAWSPMGVAVAGEDLYVLEYRYIEADRREDWLPRVRKVSREGRVTVIATVERW
jgi:streptogramin lyase